MRKYFEVYNIFNLPFQEHENGGRFSSAFISENTLKQAKRNTDRKIKSVKLAFFRGSKQGRRAQMRFGKIYSVAKISLI